MNAKWKIGFHIVVTLVIGIVIGAMLNRVLVRSWIREALTMRGAGLRVPSVERMLASVTPGQEAKIQAALDRHAQRMSQIMQGHEKELEAAFKALKDEIDPILTPEQRAELQKAIPGPPPQFAPAGVFPGGWRPRRWMFGGGPPGRFRAGELKSELGLTDEQAAKIKALLEDFEKRIQGDREKGGAPGAFEALKELRQKTDAEIEKILTDKQRETYRRLREKRLEEPPPSVPFP
jgi:Spy/CpxP family protein refolding chaperone